MKVYNKTIFIFRRDYRLYDNIGLIEALKKSVTVIPIFIFTPEQVTNNEYKSDNAFQFMVESLEDLDKELRDKGSKLYYFYSKPATIIDKLLKQDKSIGAVFVNRDYTPYSKKRDLEIQKICEKNKRVFEDRGLQQGILGHGRAKFITGTIFTATFNSGCKRVCRKNTTLKSTPCPWTLSL